MPFFSRLRRAWGVFRGRFGNEYGTMTSENGVMERREKVTVFILSFIIASVMWFVVSLGKELSTTVNLTITVGQLPDDQALSNDLPESVVASVSGEGWELVSLTRNPPVIEVDVNQPEILMTDMVREKIAPTGVNVLAVQPAILRTQLEQRISKRVPVVIDDDIQYRSQYGLVGELEVTPDSVTISGAESVVGRINSWATQPLLLENVNAAIDVEVALRKPPAILSLDASVVKIRASVSEYTEGEQRVRIEASDLPSGMEVSFSPTYVNVRFSVPIEEYTQAQASPLFSAVVPYVDIVNDSTGYVSPMITTLSDSLHTNIRLVQPRRVSYFKIIR